MTTFETAAAIARFELAAISRRADLLGTLGSLPAAPAALPLFRRRVITLPASVEVRHAQPSSRSRRDGRARIARRLRELEAARAQRAS